MSTARRILSNTFIQTLGKVLTAILSVVTIKYVTSLELNPQYAGVSSDYKLIYTYLSFFGIIADFGLFTIAVREFAHGKKEPSYILGNIFGMRFVSIFLAMALACGVVFLIQDPNYPIEVKVGVIIAAVTTALTMLASTITSVLQEKLKMSFPTIALILGKIVMTGYIVWVVMNYSIVPQAFYQLLWAGVFGSLLTFIVTYIYTYQTIPFRFMCDMSYWKDIFKRSLPYGIAIILGTIYFKVDILILSFLRDKSEIAIYGYPASVSELILIIPIYFMNSVLPTLTRVIDQKSEKIQPVISLSMYFLLSLAVLICFGGMVLARPFIELIMNEKFLSDYSAGFYGSDLALQIIFVAFLFSFVTNLFSYILITLEKQKRLLYINLYAVIFNIITNIIFIPYFGFIACGVITVISQFLVLWLTYKECKKNITFSIPKIPIIKIFLIGIIMSLVLMLVTWMNVFISSVLGLLIFSVLFYLFKVIPIKTLSDIQVIK